MAIRADFEFVLVLTYALPARALIGLVPPGLALETWKEQGFLAAAFVQTRRLRPSALPAFVGRSFFLAGYRIFCRYRTRAGRDLRGLRILRSDADRWSMVLGGNLLTRYGYRRCRVEVSRDDGGLGLRVSSRDGLGDVELHAEVGHSDETLPEGSPFSTPREARRFAGPLPYTFDYEPRTRSIIRVEGIRRHWHPRLVPVRVGRLAFLEQPPLAEARPTLASCFWIENVEYHWKRGVRERVGAGSGRAGQPEGAGTREP